MSDTFNPGDGWREVQYGADMEGHEHITWDSTGLAGGQSRMWVRVPPMLALPTEPGTAIRVTWAKPDDWEEWPTVYVFGLQYDWAWEPVGKTALIDKFDLAKWITGFEVLSEPRAVVAKAVLDRVDEYLPLGNDVVSQRYLKNIAREFGVSS